MNCGQFLLINYQLFFAVATGLGMGPIFTDVVKFVVPVNLN